jgi:hypothetical protein
LLPDFNKKSTGEAWLSEEIGYWETVGKRIGAIYSMVLVKVKETRHA